MRTQIVGNYEAKSRGANQGELRRLRLLSKWIKKNYADGKYDFDAAALRAAILSLDSMERRMDALKKEIQNPFPAG